MKLLVIKRSLIFPVITCTPTVDLGQNIRRNRITETLFVFNKTEKGYRKKIIVKIFVDNDFSFSKFNRA